jgi:protoheme IX farnesyltransferase
MEDYYRLTKPGIVYGNALTALSAFVFASDKIVNLYVLGAMMLGLMLSIASACVINNICDRDIDIHMERTKERALPTGRISVQRASVFAFILFCMGTALLYFFVNTLALLVTLFGVFMYLLVYTPLKRVSIHSTVVGALAGAVPPVVGYVGVTNAFDTTSLLLFLILVCWQMTHFLAIAIFRVEEYRSAQIPVMSVRVGMFRSKVIMLVYALLFSFALFALSVVNHLGLLFTVPLGVLSLGWILLSIQGFRTRNDATWAKQLFFYSIAVLMVFSLLLALS